MQSSYKQAEYLMYSYTRTKTLLDELKYEYKLLTLRGDLSNSKYSKLEKHKPVKDPVVNYVERIIKMERSINEKLEQVLPVERVEKELLTIGDKLAQELLDVLHFVYYAGIKHQVCAHMLKMSRSKLYYRRRELVKRVIDAKNKLIILHKIY